MTNDNHHAAFVDGWVGEFARAGSAAQLRQRFADGFEAMWTRAHVTLGDVTLNAILHRVVHTATAQHPVLATLEVQPTGLRFAGLDDPGHAHVSCEVAAALRTVLIDFLTVLGSLTADILTPALHAAIAAVTPPSMENAGRADGEDAP